MKTPGQYLEEDRNVEAFAEMDRRKGVPNPNAGKTVFTRLDEARANGETMTRADRAAQSMNRYGGMANPRGLIGGEYAPPAYRGGRWRKRIAGVTQEQAASGMNEWRNSNASAFAEMDRRKAQAAKPAKAPAMNAANPVKPVAQGAAGADLFGPERKMKLGDSQPSNRKMTQAEIDGLFQQGSETARKYNERRTSKA